MPPEDQGMLLSVAPAASISLVRPLAEAPLSRVPPSAPPSAPWGPVCLSKPRGAIEPSPFLPDHPTLSSESQGAQEGGHTWPHKAGVTRTGSAVRKERGGRTGACSGGGPRPAPAATASDRTRPRLHAHVHTRTHPVICVNTGTHACTDLKCAHAHTCGVRPAPPSSVAAWACQVPALLGAPRGHRRAHTPFVCHWA